MERAGETRGTMRGTQREEEERKGCSVIFTSCLIYTFIRPRPYWAEQPVHVTATVSERIRPNCQFQLHTAHCLTITSCLEYKSRKPSPKAKKTEACSQQTTSGKGKQRLCKQRALLGGTGQGPGSGSCDRKHQANENRKGPRT